MAIKQCCISLKDILVHAVVTQLCSCFKLLDGQGVSTVTGHECMPQLLDRSCKI